MNRIARNLLCRLLIVLMAWTPFQLSHAGMIATEQALPAAQADRASLLVALGRADVAGQLQAFGIDPAAARERVQALTDQEISALSQGIDALPAGGVDGLAIVVLLLIIGGLVWWWVFMRNPK